MKLFSSARSPGLPDLAAAPPDSSDLSDQDRTLAERATQALTELRRIHSGFVELDLPARPVLATPGMGGIRSALALEELEYYIDQLSSLRKNPVQIDSMSHLIDQAEVLARVCGKALEFSEHQIASPDSSASLDKLSELLTDAAAGRFSGESEEADYSDFMGGLDSQGIQRLFSRISDEDYECLLGRLAAHSRERTALVDQVDFLRNQLAELPDEFSLPARDKALELLRAGSSAPGVTLDEQAELELQDLVGLASLSFSPAVFQIDSLQASLSESAESYAGLKAFAFSEEAEDSPES